ncbi:MAG TPA: DUF2933 domain-containing protein [Candidatus Binatia bacterium]|jgi:hypothetical protein|nr:DUF2933 domain-containing protein [Candidatus Binatia bacterium]
MTTNQPYQAKSRSRWRSNVILLAFLAIGAFFLVTEHAAHLFGALPYLLLLACPLLHLLHGGHGSRHSGHSQSHSSHHEEEGGR